MPYVKCENCHHEWETVSLRSKCDWCGGKIGKVLEQKTPLERMMEDIYATSSNKRKKLHILPKT